MPLPPGSVWLTVLLGLLVALTPLGTDAYLPSLPAIAQAFNAPVGEVQLTITTFFLGIAGGQLAWGPLSDRYGRKPVLLSGLGLFLAATFACINAETVGGIVLWRFVQGLGMSSGPVIGRTIVRDLHNHEQAARMLARMMIVFGIVPVAAPLIGAQLLAWVGPGRRYSGCSRPWRLRCFAPSRRDCTRPPRASAPGFRPAGPSPSSAPSCASAASPARSR